MKKEVTILLAEDDPGHATLVVKNLKRGGIGNEIIRFADGAELIDFFENSAEYDSGKSYLVLLDIRMPRMDGIEALKIIKSRPTLRTVPVIMLTTTDDPVEINKCYDYGCGAYIVKPVERESFIEALRNLGLFLTVVEVPVFDKFEVK